LLTDAALPNFVNADLNAAGLSPFAPDVAAFKAGRIMLETINRAGLTNAGKCRENLI
jgi:predicted ABC-type ATPase